MKRTILLTALLLAGIAGMAQQGIDHALVKKMLPSSTNGLRNDIAPDKAIYQWQDGGVTMKCRNTYTYDEYEYFLTEVLTEMEDLGQWIPLRRETYMVNVDLVPECILTQDWDGDWVNQSQILAEYTGTYLPILQKETYQTWQGNNWVNQQQYTYTYDPVRTILVKDWFGDHWGNHYLYTFETEGQEASVLLQYWKDGAWQNQELETYQLNENGDIVECIHANWVNESVWVNDVRQQYEYDGPYQLSRMTITLWDNGAWSSTPSKTIQYEHDAMGNSLHAECESPLGGEDRNTDIEMFYNEGESVLFEDVFEVELSYLDLTAVDETPATGRFTLCPNPANDHIMVQGEGLHHVALYNLTGQCVRECASARIDLQGLASGAYLIKLYHQEGQVETQKLLVR